MRELDKILNYGPHVVLARDCMPRIVETRNLIRVFKAKDEAVKALDQVSIHIDEGEIFGLLGPNGAGKTTLIKILTTLLLPTKGEALVGGFDVTDEAHKVRQMISLVSGGETPGYGILSVSENLWFFSQLYGLPSSTAKARIKRLMTDLEFDEYADTRMSKLSTGYKQRLNLARGLLNNPRILFLDEPTLGLDVLTSMKLRAYIVDWAKREKEGTVLLTTHYMAEADEMCDRVAIIDRGRVLACDSPRALKQKLEESFIMKLEVSSVQADFSFVEDVDGVIGYSQTRSIQTDTTTVKVMLTKEEIFSTIIAKLKAQKLKILSTNEVEPTLEDVYISLVGRGFGEREGPAHES